jgi:antitoxin YobK
MIESDPMVEEMRRMVGEYCFGPVAEEMIDAVEEELGHRIPKSYRVFLRHFGAAYIGSNLLLGISDTRDTNRDEPPTWLNVADQSLTRWIHSGVSRHLIYISSDGGGFGYYLDTSRIGNEDEYLVINLGSSRNSGETIAASFFQFMQTLHDSHIAYLEWKSKQAPTKPEGFRAVMSVEDFLKRYP